MASKVIGLDLGHSAIKVAILKGAYRGYEAVDFLTDVASNEDDTELKERAIFWLGQIDDPRVADFLLSLIRGGTVRR